MTPRIVNAKRTASAARTAAERIRRDAVALKLAPIASAAMLVEVMTVLYMENIKQRSI